MTDYIEEMMKTAGVEQKITCKPQACFQVGKFVRDKCPADFKPNKECLKWQEATSARLAYPYFTAEKQLEIIKLMSSIGFFKCIHRPDTSNKYYFGWGNHTIDNKNFTQALAQLTTELMKAGELDKEKVKEILEG